ncbi:cyclin-D5-2 [Populus trichocarpa]|uniref:B-like cyclin n=1 Tax=Populus trichocarpa TaxID=3694 RepID=A8Y917_POPTR|nr:cyclin-D5-2 [Populus trichocarpa]CAN88864.1 D5-type cyclin [Populus trichocarpa]|eukprot:XP_002302410.3 cyclin-D5-2 [Populus trichocarpa]
MAGESLSPNDLLRQEDFRAELSVADEDDTYIDISRTYVGDPDTEEEEYLALLANQEPHRGFSANDTLVIDSWFRNARLEAITWILRTRKTFGFHFHTAYLSMIYFDRFISSRSIDRRYSWVVKLISVACISLASKMEEVQVPSSPEFQTDGVIFESKSVKRVELGILSTLQWRMNYTTPFAFLRYFIMRFSRQDSPPRETISRTVRYILALMKEIHLMSHRPSVIAAAASLVVINNSLTRTTLETQMNSVAYPGFLNIEDVFRCYNLLQQLDVENLRSTANGLPLKARPALFLFEALLAVFKFERGHETQDIVYGNQKEFLCLIIL